MLGFLNTNTVGGIFLIIAILIVSGLLIWLLVVRTRHDRLYFIDLYNKKRIFTKPEMLKSLNGSISINREFYLFMLQARSYKDLISLYSQDSVESAMNLIFSRIDTEMPEGVRLSRIERDSILVFVKQEKNIDIGTIAKKLKDISARNVLLESRKNIRIDFSVAIVGYPNDGDNLSTLMSMLQISLTDGKRAVSGNLTVSRSGQIAVEDYETERKEIKEALDKEQFVLFYHPVLETRNMKIAGAECLIRWNHPTRGMLPPSAFFPVFERLGEMHALALWVFDHSAKQLAYWRSQKSNNLWLSVNMSINQLSNPIIVREFTKILKKYDLVAGDFYFEVYDLAMYSKLEGIRTTVDQLSRMGFKISVDKFGKGSSSITELEQLPLSQIKVDMSLLERARENVLYGGIINTLSDYVRQKNIMLVADGVENKEDLDLAHIYKLPYLQGFYFTRPVSTNEFENLFTDDSWKIAKGIGDSLSTSINKKIASPDIKVGLIQDDNTTIGEKINSDKIDSDKSNGKKVQIDATTPELKASVKSFSGDTQIVAPSTDSTPIDKNVLKVGKLLDEIEMPNVDNTKQGGSASEIATASEQDASSSRSSQTGGKQVAKKASNGEQADKNTVAKANSTVKKTSTVKKAVTSSATASKDNNTSDGEIKAKKPPAKATPKTDGEIKSKKPPAKATPKTDGEVKVKKPPAKASPKTDGNILKAKKSSTKVIEPIKIEDSRLGKGLMQANSQPKPTNKQSKADPIKIEAIPTRVDGFDNKDDKPDT
ncbi:MAG: EAL domain-containing protein [Clostridia bacterium]